MIDDEGYITVVDALPKTPSGKLLKLREQQAALFG
jgi:acyl-coenzyme A synthetase/AMP-(fatty) acid ligase